MKDSKATESQNINWCVNKSILIIRLSEYTSISCYSTRAHNIYAYINTLVIIIYI